MFGMGMGELLVIFIVALIVLGPARLPKLAQDLGKAIREFRKAADDVKQELTADDEIRKPFQELHEAVTLSPEELKRREEERQRADAAAAQMAAARAQVLDDLVDGDRLGDRGEQRGERVRTPAGAEPVDVQSRVAGLVHGADEGQPPRAGRRVHAERDERDAGRPGRSQCRRERTVVQERDRDPVGLPGDGLAKVCPACGESIPIERVVAHDEGRDGARPGCAHQDLAAIAAAERNQARGWWDAHW